MYLVAEPDISRVLLAVPADTMWRVRGDGDLERDGIARC